MQNAFCHPSGGFAQVGRDVSAQHAIIPTVAELVRTAHEAGVLVIWTIQEGLGPDDRARLSLQIPDATRTRVDRARDVVHPRHVGRAPGRTARRRAAARGPRHPQAADVELLLDDPRRDTPDPPDPDTDRERREYREVRRVHRPRRLVPRLRRGRRPRRGRHERPGVPRRLAPQDRRVLRDRSPESGRHGGA